MKNPCDIFECRRGCWPLLLLLFLFFGLASAVSGAGAAGDFAVGDDDLQNFAILQGDIVDPVTLRFELCAGMLRPDSMTLECSISNRWTATDEAGDAVERNDCDQPVDDVSRGIVHWSLLFAPTLSACDSTLIIYICQVYN